MRLAYAAAGAESFYLDAAAYDRARAQKDSALAATIKARFDRRYIEVESLLETIVGTDVEGSTVPRAASLRRMLKKHRERVK